MNSNIPDSNCLDCVRKRASLTYMIQNRFCISTEVLRELMTHPSHKKVTEITLTLGHLKALRTLRIKLN